MTSKSFTSYKPTGPAPEFDINGTVFHMKHSVPGDVLLDFLANTSTDNPADLAKTVRGLLFEAVVPEELDAFKTFIRDPENNVGLDLLAELAGYTSEVLAGGNERPVSSLGG